MNIKAGKLHKEIYRNYKFLGGTFFFAGTAILKIQIMVFSSGKWIRDKDLEAKILEVKLNQKT